MISIKFVQADGTEQEVSAQPGQSVMETAIWNNVPGIEAVCGGAMACCTCLVQVGEEWRDKFPAPSPAETELISTHSHATPASRLSCQLRVIDAIDGIALRPPPEQQ
jgi:2Fe-2S ferredoxin